MSQLTVVLADDERPARNFLKSILKEFDDVKIVGEAGNGAEAIDLITKYKPDIALLDLQMPEVSGLDVVKNLDVTPMPSVAFLTAYDEFAIQAFELNAVDYLLKPIEKERLRETIDRVYQRTTNAGRREAESKKLRGASEVYEASKKNEFLKRIPVKGRDEIVLLPVEEIASIVAEAELLHFTTVRNKTFIINFRLKDIEARLEPESFIRLSRGSLANVNQIKKINPMPGGTYSVLLANGQELTSSRLQSKVLREKLLRL